MLLRLHPLVRVTKNKNYLVDQCYFESMPLDRHAEVRSNDHSEMFSFRNNNKNNILFISNKSYKIQSKSINT